jgi:selenophosphate synthetase-related protein
MDDAAKRYVKDIEWIRDSLAGMDDMCSPIMGIRDWDDAVCVDFEGRLVVSTDGPYAKRLVMKSALIHAATDVVVKGARPMFALDNMIGSRKDVEDMMASLRQQAEAMGIPILGGNTFFEDSEPLCCVTVAGKLLIDEPIRDSGAKEGDIIALVGEPLWGERDERLRLAKAMFDAWFDAIERVEINSAKDVTKGGLVAVVYEMEKKSGRKFKLDEGLPYHMSRNLDNFIATMDWSQYEKLDGICKKRGCRLARVGVVQG